MLFTRLFTIRPTFPLMPLLAKTFSLSLTCFISKLNFKREALSLYAFYNFCDFCDSKIFPPYSTMNNDLEKGVAGKVQPIPTPVEENNTGRPAVPESEQPSASQLLLSPEGEALEKKEAR